MQLNRTGYLLIALFLFGGIAFLLVDLFVFGTAAFLLIGVIWILTSLGVVLYAIRSAAKARHEEWLFKSGLPGRATIVSATSRATVNDQPLINFVLDVEVPGQGARRVKKRELISNFAAPRMQPGLTLPTYVNPRDPEDLLLVW